MGRGENSLIKQDQIVMRHPGFPASAAWFLPCLCLFVTTEDPKGLFSRATLFRNMIQKAQINLISFNT